MQTKASLGHLRMLGFIKENKGLNYFTNGLLTVFYSDLRYIWDWSARTDTRSIPKAKQLAHLLNNMDAKHENTKETAV